MNRTILTALAAGVLFCAGAAWAQDDESKANVQRVYIVDVNAGEGQAFEDGWMAYMKCYGDHGGKHEMHVWWRETGKLGVYAFVTGNHKWADWDEQEAADEACDDVFHQQFLPHIHKAKSEFNNYMPDASYIRDSDDGQAWNVAEVINFDTTDNRAFVDNIKKITEAAKATKWDTDYAWYSVEAAGESSADFYVVILGHKFADWDKDNMPLWEMVAKHAGKDGAEKIRKALRDSIRETWTNVWRHRSDLDYTPKQ